MSSNFKIEIQKKILDLYQLIKINIYDIEKYLIENIDEYKILQDNYRVIKKFKYITKYNLELKNKIDIIPFFQYIINYEIIHNTFIYFIEVNSKPFILNKIKNEMSESYYNNIIEKTSIINNENKKIYDIILYYIFEVIDNIDTNNITLYDIITVYIKNITELTSYVYTKIIINFISL